MKWGRDRQHRVWVAPKPLYWSGSRWRVLWRGHDALYVEAGRVRVRIMKPARR